MTSVSSRGRSPHSPYDFDSTGETEESWQYLEYGSSGPGSIGFLPSPASGSLNGYAIVGQVPTTSPAALSPLYLDIDQPAYPTTSFDQADAFTTTSAPTDAHFISGGQDADQFLTPGNYLLTEQQLAELNTFGSFMTSAPLNGLEAFDAQQAQLDLGIPPSFQASPLDVAPWNPTNLKADLTFDDYSSSNDNSTSTSPVISGTSSPEIKQEGDKSPTSSAAIRKVKASKVEKKKSEQASKFVIVTPTSINAHAGRPNPFECFDAMRTSQRGRKGPLANATKQSALQVRRVGACFCCHSRKVKCDKERPCKNCKKIMIQVPQVVCWQFQDFLTVLFPDFIRGHFRKDQMQKFMAENTEGFGETAQSFPIELFSGPRFSTVLTVKAKFFIPKTDDVQKHWHLHVGKDRVELQSRDTAPLGIELENIAQRDELRKKAKEYIHTLTSEPSYPEQVTDAFRHTKLPRTILTIVQSYATRSGSPIVKKALSIYAAHYVMTRHLCLTKKTILDMQETSRIPQNVPWITPRVLNRQVKSVVDELMMREMQVLFESFSKSLKPKSRREWAPCLAAFLVLCLFMEALETASDTFVTALNEIAIRNNAPPEFRRQVALDLNREIENMPFKQFVYQFHQIYQTHSKDASTKPFNPILDHSFIQQGDIDAAAEEMVLELRKLVRERESWEELDFLTADPILTAIEGHSFPRDVSQDYTGRLVAKFLLSFTNEKYIFGPN